MRKGPEKNFWRWLDKVMANCWSVQRHEDRYSVGIPDLSYGVNNINGWIELKAYEQWPVNTIKHFTAKQAAWLTNRGEAGGHCFILIRINGTILLFNWKKAYALLTDIKGEYELCYYAKKVWESTFNKKEFIGLIT